MPVHLFGQCADMDPILEAAGRYEVPVVEDAAQAIGAAYPGKEGARRAGAMGLMGCFSFFPSKNLGAMGDGGMTVTSDDGLASRLRMLRNHGDEGGYTHVMVGGNFRLDAMQAAILRVKLKHLDGWAEARRKNAAYYDERFAGSPIESPQAAYGREHHVYNQYVIRVPERRDDLKAHLAQQEIGCSVYYPRCFHEQPCFSELGYSKGAFPEAEDAAARSLALPIYGELTEDLLDTVAGAVLDFYR
jgi:dTDP-4-amino-4,6-dideoxygalactose transaminase